MAFLQVLKLFFARFDSARPSAVLMNAIDRAQSLDPTGEGYTPTPLAGSRATGDTMRFGVSWSSRWGIPLI